MASPKTAKGSTLSAIHGRTAKSKPIRVPALPKTIDPSLKGEWTRIVKFMIGQNGWAPEKSTLLETYFVNLQAMRDAQNRMTLDGGPIGQDGRPHAASAIIARHSGFLTKIAPQLGLGREALTQIKEPKQPTTAKASTWSA